MTGDRSRVSCFWSPSRLQFLTYVYLSVNQTWYRRGQGFRGYEQHPGQSMTHAKTTTFSLVSIYFVNVRSIYLCFLRLKAVHKKKHGKKDVNERQYCCVVLCFFVFIYSNAVSEFSSKRIQINKLTVVIFFL